MENTEQKPISIWKKIFLKTWHPQPTVFSTIILFLVLAVIFLIFGIVLLLINASIVEATMRYDDKCRTIGQNCLLDNFIVDDDMEPPIYVYYELHNFYQNHRRYIKSQSTKQLAGDVISSSSDCDPVETNAEMNKTISVTGGTLKQSDIAYPCGLIAKSYFTDRYQFDSYEIDEKDIAWKNDIGNKYRRASNYPDAYWIDVEDEHFAVWMRTAGLPDFRKLWGKIETKIPKGTYKLTIENNYDVSIFEGEKHFVLSTCGPFGGKNSFLAVAYLVIGGVCLVIVIIFFVKKKISTNFGERKVM